MDDKTNLTLRIRKDVLDKARELGLNLSAITESFLKTETLVDDEIVTAERLRTSYIRVLMSISEILKDWGVYLKIGDYTSLEEFRDNEGKKHNHEMSFHLWLSPNGKIELTSDEIDETMDSWNLNEGWPIENIFEPEQIVEELIERLYTQAGENRKKLEKLRILSNVLNALKNKDKKEDKKSENDR